jgi:hypothetical protein
MIWKPISRYEVPWHLAGAVAPIRDLAEHRLWFGAVEAGQVFRVVAHGGRLARQGVAVTRGSGGDVVWWGGEEP